MEHRWGTRAPCQFPVDLRRPDLGAAGGYIENISVSGALIRTDRTLPPMTQLDVMIGGERIPAWIVRRLPGAIGVEWCELAPRAVVALLRPVATHQPVNDGHGSGASANLAA